MNARPEFQLTLHPTYCNQGFFNVPVDFDRYIRSSNGPVTLILGGKGQEIDAEVNRRANQNGTARVMGRTALRNWFQQTYVEYDVIPVRFETPERLVMG